MSWIERLLTRMEAGLRLVIEGDPAVDGFPRQLHRQLQRELIHTMQSAARRLPDASSPARQNFAAPDLYTLVLPSIEAQILLTHPSELDRLSRILQNAVSRAGMSCAAIPTLRVVADPQAVAVNISAEFYQPGMGDSLTYQLEGAREPARQLTNSELPKAYLIVNGLSTFFITKAVVNIGRDPTNQLVLNDPKISLQHAQLRLVHGRFFIFDLDSQRGTFVNGVPVSSHALNPGDVIQLAGLPLVYGQETEPPACQTQELPANPPPPEVL